MRATTAAGVLVLLIAVVLLAPRVRGAVLLPDSILVSLRDQLLLIDPDRRQPEIVSSTSVGLGIPYPGIRDFDLGRDGFIYATSGVVVYRIDPVTGDRELISSADRGEGPRFWSLRTLVAARDGTIYVSQIEPNYPYTFQVMAIDPVIGDRTLVLDVPIEPGFTVDAMEELADGRLLYVEGIPHGGTTGGRFLQALDPSSGTLERQLNLLRRATRAIVATRPPIVFYAINTGAGVQNVPSILEGRLGISRHRPLIECNLTDPSLAREPQDLALDSRGRLIIAASGVESNCSAEGLPSLAGHVYRMDPATGETDLLYESEIIHNGAGLLDVVVVPADFPFDDVDQDGIADVVDSCPLAWNIEQADTDGDGVGDACNDADDLDGDEWSDLRDSCPLEANPGQEDIDADGIGDVCDPFPEDPDNEQALCELRSGLCSSDLDQCAADLGATGADLFICEADLDTLMQILEPELLLETAAMGAPGALGPTSRVGAKHRIGARFELTEGLVTGALGAHLVGDKHDKPGEVFGAIVALDGPDDYPDSVDLSTPDVLRVVRLELPRPSAEVLVPVSAPLLPGWYALVLGSGRFGASGEGGVTLNNPDAGPRSVFTGTLHDGTWQEANLPARLVVTRKSPELLACESDLGQCQALVVDETGDLNGDGAADLADVVIFRRSLAGESVR